MSADDRLKRSASRLNAELDKMAVPTPPSRGGSRFLAFAFGAVATLAVIAGGIYLLGNLDEPEPIAAGSTSTSNADPDTTQPTATTVGVVSDNYGGTVTVIDDGDGAVVCAGGVLESYPPQCDGPALVGIDWADVPWADSANGATWAQMAIEVTIEDSGDLTLVGMPSRPSDPSGGDDVDFTPPCPAPDGGWVWSDGPKTSQADFDAAMAHIQSQPDVSATWVYNLLDPEVADQEGRREVVLVALFTGAVDEHEAAIRELWGGPLCVAEGVTKSADLLALQDELTDRAYSGEIPGLTGFGYSYTDEVTGTVVLGALIATAEASEWLASNYADMPIRLESMLEPVVTASSLPWEEPATYSFVVESSCGERSLIGVFEVEVVDHEVSAATGRNAQAKAMLEFSGLGDVPTLADILEEAAAAQASGADDVSVSYASDGTPRSISIDREINAIDDESCYVISEYEAG